MYVLTITLNGSDFVATATKRAALFATLETNGVGSLVLRVQDEQASAEGILLDGIAPSDTLRFTYQITDEAPVRTLAALGQHQREPARRVTPGYRLALDVLHTRYPRVRISYPGEGDLTLMLGTIPRDHARVFVMAGEQEVTHHWQLPDLYSGDWIGFEVVESDWASPYPEH